MYNPAQEVVATMGEWEQSRPPFAVVLELRKRGDRRNARALPADHQLIELLIAEVEKKTDNSTTRRLPAKQALAAQKQLSDVRAPVREADWSVWTVAAGLDHCIATASEVARRKISDSPGQEDESSRRSGGHDGEWEQSRPHFPVALELRKRGDRRNAKALPADHQTDRRAGRGGRGEDIQLHHKSTRGYEPERDRFAKFVELGASTRFEKQPHQAGSWRRKQTSCQEHHRSEPASAQPKFVVISI